MEIHPNLPPLPPPPPQTSTKPSQDHQKPWTYTHPTPIYSLCTSPHRDNFKIAMGSFITRPGVDENGITVVDPGSGSRVESSERFSFPVTKVMWCPRVEGSGSNEGRREVLASSGDMVRIWEFVEEDGGGEDNDDTVDVDVAMEEGSEAGDVEMGNTTPRLSEGKVLSPKTGMKDKGKKKCSLNVKAQLINSRRMGQGKRDYTAPITSFDWNHPDPTQLVTSSIDTTCSIWDLSTQQLKTQLIAHDKQVYDVSWNQSNAYIFTSVGADGSVRVFDLRGLEHSTILFETSSTSISSLTSPTSPTLPHPQLSSPLLRVSWNALDQNLISTFAQNSSSLLILDIRVPAIPLYALSAHTSPITCSSWSSSRPKTVYTTAQDGVVLEWDLDSPELDSGTKTKCKTISTPKSMFVNGEYEVVENMCLTGNKDREWMVLAGNRNNEGIVKVVGI